MALNSRYMNDWEWQKFKESTAVPGQVGIVVLGPDGGGIPITTAGYTVSTVTSVDDSASSVTLIASNPSRKEVIIQNDSSSTLYIKLGTTATTTDYSFKAYTDDAFITNYTGRIDAIWSSNSTGAAKVTELR